MPIRGMSAGAPASAGGHDRSNAARIAAMRGYGNIMDGRVVRLGSAAVLAVLCVATAMTRGDEPSREYQVKAAFLFNFAEFTQWPDSAFAGSDGPFVVAVIGQNPFGQALEHTMEGKSIAGHPVVVRYIDSSGDVPGCHVLFVPASEDGRLDDIFKQVADRPILTVGESEKFPWAGGIIRFLIEDNKVRFEINPDAAAKASLHISSKLMCLARIFKKQ